MSHDPWGGGSDANPKLRDEERAWQRFRENARAARVARLIRDVPGHKTLPDRLAPLIPVLATICGILALINFYVR